MNFNLFGRKKEVDRKIDEIIGKKQGEGSSGVVNNPNYRTFSRVNNDIATIINSRSVVTQAAHNQHFRAANPTWQVSFGDDFLAIPVATNKSQRIAMYRSMATYPICKWCLEEIADDFIHDDENRNFITLALPKRLNATQ